MDNFEHRDIVNVLDDSGLVPTNISLRVGNKVIKYSSIESETITLKDEIIEDYHVLYRKKIDELNVELQKRAEQYKFMYDKKMDEISNLKYDLSKQLRNTNIMPDITYDHTCNGLSISRDHPMYNTPNIVWLYRGKYQAKYLNRDRIDPVFYRKKLTKDVIIEIVTSGFTVVSLKVLNPDMSKFMHYHSMGMRDDCWGNWRYNDKEIKGANDVIILATRALDVLSTINELSIGNRTPRGLSRLPTIRRNLLQPETTVHNENIESEEPIVVEPQRRQNRERRVWDINRL